MDRDDTPPETDTRAARDPHDPYDRGNPQHASDTQHASDPQQASDPWAPLHALVVAFEASARLEPVLDKALLWAGRGWLDTLGKGGDGRSLAQLKAAGLELSWMKGEHLIPELVDQVALLRGRPALPKREGGRSTLEPLGRRPKGWKPIGLELRRGLPSNADASPAAVAAKALSARLSERRDDPGGSTFPSIDRENPAIEEALAMLRAWLTLLATPSGARGEIEVPDTGWDAPLTAFLDGIGLQDQGARDAAGRMAHIHVLLRDAVAFDRYHAAMALPVPPLAGDPDAAAALSALETWSQAEAARPKADPDAARRKAGRTEVEQTNVGQTEASDLIVGGDGSGATSGYWGEDTLDGTAGTDTLSLDTGLPGIGPPMTGPGTVGPGAENAPGLVAQLQLFLGEVAAEWPSWAPKRKRNEIRDRRSSNYHEVYEFPFLFAIDGVVSESFFTGLAFWNLSLRSSGSLSLSDQQRRKALSELESIPSHYPALASIRKDDPTWNVLAVRSGYGDAALHPVGNPPVLVVSEHDQTELFDVSMSDAFGLTPYADAALRTAYAEFHSKTGAGFLMTVEGPGRSPPLTKKETTLPLSLRCQIVVTWIGEDRQSRRSVIDGLEGSLPTAASTVLVKSRAESLQAVGLAVTDNGLVSGVGEPLWREQFGVARFSGMHDKQELYYAFFIGAASYVFFAAAGIARILASEGRVAPGDDLIRSTSDYLTSERERLERKHGHVATAMLIAGEIFPKLVFRSTPLGLIASAFSDGVRAYGETESVEAGLRAAVMDLGGSQLLQLRKFLTASLRGRKAMAEADAAAKRAKAPLPKDPAKAHQESVRRFGLHVYDTYMSGLTGRLLDGVLDPDEAKDRYGQ